jgi:hypothetical protein
VTAAQNAAASSSLPADHHALFEAGISAPVVSTDAFPTRDQHQDSRIFVQQPALACPVLSEGAVERRDVRTPPRGECSMKRQLVTAVVAVAFASGFGLAGCEKGPVQKAGEKVDEATGQDKLIGKGPAEKTGRKIDNTVEDVKK